jgi:hypothetical protein
MSSYSATEDGGLWRDSIESTENTLTGFLLVELDVTLVGPGNVGDESGFNYTGGAFCGREYGSGSPERYASTNTGDDAPRRHSRLPAGNRIKAEGLAVQTE